jgi:hypothetical protein
MFGLFNKNNENSVSLSVEWLPQIQENQQRFFDFLNKIEVRMQELTDAAVPELTEMRNSTDESFKMDFRRMKSGIDGQLENIRKKVYDVHDEKILDLFNEIKHNYSPKDKERDILNAFRNDCRSRYNLFEEKYQAARNAVDATDYEDYEIAYEKVLNEYATIKDKFHCKQCGSLISIEKIFFINVHLNCSACQTQNTFEPSTHARMVQHFAQNLAHQRATDLYEKYKIESEKERLYYHEMHPLKLSLHFEKDTKIKSETETKIEDLEAKRQESIQNTPIFYKDYLHKKYTEWKKITPDMEAHLETRLQNELASIEE